MATARAFIAGFRLEDAPADVVHQAKRCLLDLIGVAAAGSQLPASRIIRSVAHSQFGGSGGYFLFDGGRPVLPARRLPMRRRSMVSTRMTATR